MQISYEKATKLHTKQQINTYKGDMPKSEKL